MRLGLGLGWGAGRAWQPYASAMEASSSEHEGCAAGPRASKRAPHAWGEGVGVG